MNDDQKFYFTEWNVYEIYAENREAAMALRDEWLENDESHPAVKHRNCGTDWEVA